jgi:hypothetical protein
MDHERHVEGVEAAAREVPVMNGEFGWLASEPRDEPSPLRATVDSLR